MASPSTPATDLLLLQRVVGRDQAALAELYDRRSRVLFSLIARIVRSHSDAEEVLQEVFVRVWTRAAPPVDPSPAVRERLLARISGPGRYTFAAAEGQWNDSGLPGIRVKVLAVDDARVLRARDCHHADADSDHGEIMTTDSAEVLLVGGIADYPPGRQ